MDKIVLSEEYRKKIIDFLQNKGINLDEFDFEDFEDYLIKIGIENKNILDRRFLTKANLEKFYDDFNNPIKRVTKILKITNKELAEKISYSESTVKNASAKNEVSPSMKRSIELFFENVKLKQELKNEKNKTIEFKKYLKEFLNNK